MYGAAIRIFTSLRQKKGAYFIGDKQYMYGLFLANLVASAPTAAAAAAAALPAKTKTAMTVAGTTAIEEEIQTKRKLESSIPDEPEAEEEKEELEDDIEETKAVGSGLEPDEAVAEKKDADVHIKPSTERKKKVASIFANIQSAITSWGRWAIGAAGGGGGGGAQGGGGNSGNSSPEDNLTTAEFLVKLYFRELYYSLYAFESEGNFDYDYYKTIATIAVVVAKLYPGDWLKQQAFFYDEFPKMNFTDIYPSDKLAYMRHGLYMALGSLTARTVGLPPGPVPSLGFTGIGAIPLAESLAYARQLRSLDFMSQRDTLIEACEAAVLFGAAAPVAAAAPPINMAALNRNRRSRKAAANAAVAAAAARGRTLGTGAVVSDPAFTTITVPETPVPGYVPSSAAAPSYEMVSPAMSRGGRQRRTKRRARRAASSYKARAARRYTRRR
jgi:hypothetical protein